MSEDAGNRAAELIELTADIVSAFVSNNPLPTAGLPDLIASVHLSLAGLNRPAVAPAQPLVPAVNPKKSVFPDYIICLDDGKKLRSMKRHIGLLGMTPDDYRVKWSLPAGYPMVAPNYAAKRSELAKAIGLGRKRAPAPAQKTPAKRKSKAS